MKKEIKKAVSCILVAGMGIAPSVSCVNASVPVSVYVGQKKQLNWDYGKVRKWWSVDNSTVKVSSKGKITGLKEGSTVVKAKAYKGKHWRIRWFNVKVTDCKAYTKLKEAEKKLKKMKEEKKKERAEAKKANEKIWKTYDWLEDKAGENFKKEQKLWEKCLDIDDSTPEGKKEIKKLNKEMRKADKEMDGYIDQADRLKDAYVDLAGRFKTED